MARSTVQTPGRRQRSESKQTAILDAAERLFVADGYELTSVDAIAAAAGVSKRTVYDHFGDKHWVDDFDEEFGAEPEFLSVTLGAVWHLN